MKKPISFIACTIFFFSLFAQNPNWIVNPNEYLYNMTVTAVADINCAVLSDTGNVIAAFIGNKVHGVAKTDVVVNGSYQANLIIYSNLVGGQRVTFKLYNSALDSVYTSIDTIDFEDNKIIGNPLNPFHVRTNHRADSILLSSNVLDENVAPGTLVGNLSTVDKDANQSYTYSLVGGEGDSNNMAFTINSNQLTINISPDYESQRQYSIRAQTMDNMGCSLSQQFLIHINDINDLPSKINLSDTSFDENLALNSNLAQISAVDADSNNNSIFVYTLAAGTGDDDNAAFAIVGNELQNKGELDFEKQSLYKIRIQVLDDSGGVFQQMFNCTLNDLNEKPIMVEQNFIISENAAVDAVVDTITFIDEDLNQTHTFNYLNSDKFPFEIGLYDGIITLKSPLDYEKIPNYQFQVEIRDDGFPEMRDTATINIAVKDEIENDLPTSNFISPNGDGKNDVWKIKNVTCTVAINY